MFCWVKCVVNVNKILLVDGGVRFLCACRFSVKSFYQFVDRIVLKFPTVIVGSSMFPFSSLVLLPIFCSSVIWGICI